MTADLAALRDALAKATDRPWVVYPDSRPGIDSEAPEPHGRNIVYAARFANDGFGGVGRTEDAALIVLAVNSLPALIAELEALRAVASAARVVVACGVSNRSGEKYARKVEALDALDDALDALEPGL